jgi:hypothetical protein
MSRILLSALMVLGALVGHAREPSRLSGRIENGVYYAADGSYRIDIPVLPELGGSVSDTPTSVTFEDSYSVHISIASFRQDAAQRWQLSTRGTKDYLVYFFAEFVLRDFKRVFGAVQVEKDGLFLPHVLDGAFVTFVSITGGSMFMDRLHIVTQQWTLPVAKRGNLIFVKNGSIFVISIELADRVLEGGAYTRSPQEEDELLKRRLLDTVARMSFPAAKNP